MRRIAVEEHCSTEGYVNYLRSRKEPPRLDASAVRKDNAVERMWHSKVDYNEVAVARLKELTDTGVGRIAVMDKVGIDVQVLSLTRPGVDELDRSSGAVVAPKVNDELAKSIKLNPDRFIGLASVAPGNPDEASKELQRAVKELGFKGAKINSHGRGEYLDNEKYWGFWGKAEELGVPIFIHPKEPPEDTLRVYDKYPELARAAWGFGSDAGLHVLRLIFSGLFDAHPKLTIILGHMGEAVPFWLWRIDRAGARLGGKLRRKPSEYFKSNFYVTTSGMFWDPVLAFTSQAIGIEKIMFGVDYPYEDNQTAVKFMDNTPISNEAREKIYHSNAEKLFDL